MLPIRDSNPSRTVPVVNNTIIGICVVVFLIELGQGSGFDKFLYLYGLVPARYSVPEMAAYFSFFQQAFSFLSFMFLHGGFWHILFNMWVLYIFGDNIEDRLGHGRYAAFYLLCGLASGLAHMIPNIQSTVPVVGASGAIAGVMGAYFILYPRAKVLTLVPLLFIPLFFEIPAFFFLGFWFVMQVLSAAGSSGGIAGGGVAWWAHVGGFVAGIVLLRMFKVMPAQALSERPTNITTRRKSPRIQVIHPTGPGNDPNLYGDITITSLEGITGATKTVNIPWGFQSRLYKVAVPPGTKSGATLRLKGLGRIAPDGTRGDLFLKVNFM
ncbi:MAG: rhomboid family intramembrane serine protease [Thermodesulfobacteriota bacterium]|nr:rhomboid family intramembrane serine protease [Thermodesulfobacteriota bacterium]